MFTDPVENFFEIVVPAYEQYVALSKRKDNKKAVLYNAATKSASLLFELSEILEQHFKKKELTREELSKICPDFSWITDIGIALKHKKVDRKYRIINDRSAIQEIIMDSMYQVEPGFVPQKYRRKFDARIMITPIKGMGRVRDLLEVCTSVVNFWSSYLYNRKLTHNTVSFRYEGDDVPNEFSEEDGHGPSMFPKADGIGKTLFMARYYDLKDKRFYRCGFRENGSVIIGKRIDDFAHNAVVSLTYDTRTG